MDYLITWPEGDDVQYRFVSESELEKVLEEEKHYMVIPLKN